jgi:hypothetical protein
VAGPDHDMIERAICRLPGSLPACTCEYVNPANTGTGLRFKFFNVPLRWLLIGKKMFGSTVHPRHPASAHREPTRIQRINSAMSGLGDQRVPASLKLNHFLSPMMT